MVKTVSDFVEIRTAEDDERIRQLKEEYGDSIKGLVKIYGPCYAAYELGLTVKDIKLVCTMLKIDGRRNGVIPSGMIEEWKREFELCGSVKNIANDWGVSPQTVRSSLEAFGVDTTSQKKVNHNSMDKARKMFGDGLSVDMIMKSTGLTHAGVMYALGEA